MSIEETRATEPEPEVIGFPNRAAFEAWAAANVQAPDDFVQGSYDGIARWDAWRAAGNTGLPPGYVRWRDYKAQRGL